jgi:hypothetical protein
MSIVRRASGHHAWCSMDMRKMYTGIAPSGIVFVLHRAFALYAGVFNANAAAKAVHAMQNA